MSNKSDGSKKGPVTGDVQFGSLGTIGGNLFQVVPGIPLLTAAEEASNRADVLQDGLMALLHSHEHDLPVQQSIVHMQYLVEQINGLLWSIVEGLENAERGDAAPTPTGPQQAAA